MSLLALRKPAILTLSLALLAGSTQVRAESADLTGRTVRIWAPSVTQKRITATLVSTGPSRILLAPHRTPGDTIEIDLQALRVVEVAEGKRSNMLLGAVAGVGAGAAIGAVVGLLGREDPNSSDQGSGTAIGIGVGVGFIVGTIIGIASESEVWKRIPPDRLRLGHSSIGGTTVAASIAFSLPGP